MSEAMNVAANPCASCPYAKATPVGVWAENEYEKLPMYDDDQQTEFGIFLCHHSPFQGETVCRGWLWVARESVAARLGVLNGKFTEEQKYTEPSAELYATGREACDAGLAGIDNPSEEAQQLAQKILDKRERHNPTQRIRK